MKYRIDLSEQDYMDILTILVKAYSKGENKHSKHLVETFVNERIIIHDGA